MSGFACVKSYRDKKKIVEVSLEEEIHSYFPNGFFMLLVHFLLCMREEHDVSPSSFHKIRCISLYKE